jgi:hypothetical protein
MRLVHTREDRGTRSGVAGENVHVEMAKQAAAYLKMLLSHIRHAFFQQYFPGMASTDPEPDDKEAFIQAQLYDYHYKSALPSSYIWPKL